MLIILTHDVPKLGRRGDAKNVKDGYFRNFLAPKRLAIQATESRLKEAEKIRATQLLKLKEQIDQAKKIAEQLKEVVLTFKKKVTAKNKLYGSIGEKDIIESLKKAKNIQLEKEHIKLADHLKELGEFMVPVQLTEDVKTQIKVVVEKE